MLGGRGLKKQAPHRFRDYKTTAPLRPPMNGKGAARWGELTVCEHFGELVTVASPEESTSLHREVLEACRFPHVVVPKEESSLRRQKRDFIPLVEDSNAGNTSLSSLPEFLKSALSPRTAFTRSLSLVPSESVSNSTPFPTIILSDCQVTLQL